MASVHVSARGSRIVKVFFLDIPKAVVVGNKFRSRHHRYRLITCLRSATGSRIIRRVWLSPSEFRDTSSILDNAAKSLSRLRSS